MPDRAVIFDLDGTLAETAPDLMQATNHVLAEHGRPPLSPEQVRAFVGHGARVLIARGFEATGEPVPAEAMEPLYERFVTFYSANIAAGSYLFPGARNLLERCRKEGLALGVCTNKLEGLSVQLLQALDASHYFGAIVGPDTIGIAKPDAAPYRETLRRLGGTHLRSVMVGDSETDIKTARAAGVPAIGVTFGYTSRPVVEFGPDRLVSHFDDMWPAIAELLHH
jgi:phosphoglycolate phosphatase